MTSTDRLQRMMSAIDAARANISDFNGLLDGVTGDPMINDIAQELKDAFEFACNAYGQLSTSYAQLETLAAKFAEKERVTRPIVGVSGVLDA